MRESLRVRIVLGLLISISVISTHLSCAFAAEEDSTARNVIPAVAFDPDLPWLNVARPLRLEDLKGKVTVLDFWTYGCVNCIHVLADLRRLEHKYGDRLAVIGVHSPKFDNEKNLETLRSIVVRYEIAHPVVNDIDFKLGKYYGMRAWPTQVVIDPLGEVVGRLTGEGHYFSLDQLISQLLHDHHAVLNSSPLPLRLEKRPSSGSLLAAPGKIAVSERYVAVSDALHHRVIVMDHEGENLKYFGGKGAGLRDGNADVARFYSPQGLVFSGRGLYVADTGNHSIRHIDIPDAQVKTIAGNGSNEIIHGGQFDALSIGLRSPWALALQGSDLYIAMAGMHQIWRLDLAVGKVGPYAGSGEEGLRDGPIDSAQFSQPSGLSLAGEWLYVADAEASALRRIHLSQERVETLVGKGLFDFGDRDGSFEHARLQHVLGVAALEHSKVLIADTYNHKLKLLDLQRRVIKTLAGTAQPEQTAGARSAAGLNEPGGLAVLGNRVLIADTNNHRIAQYDLETGTLEEWKITH
ncbi:MAG: thioredoxin-like domain-containing protein [Pseudomonadota bacterium]